MSERKKPSILIVEDDETNLDILVNVFQNNYEIYAALEGESALKLAREEQIDLILLDIMMPGINGYEVCEKLKANPKTQPIPVIFLTGETKLKDVIQGFKKGAVDYILKPFEIEELKMRVQTHLDLRYYQQVIEEEKKLLMAQNLQMEQELAMAQLIQKAMIPKEAPSRHVSFFYQPMLAVGGDFFDFVSLDGGQKLGIFLSDVSGHGVPAAFVTIMIKSFIKSCGNRNENPSELLMFLNDSLMDLTGGNFVTAFYGILDFQKKNLVFSNAGHDHPYYISNNQIGKINTQKNGIPLALYSNEMLKKMNKHYQNEELQIKEGAKLLFYTDGLTECSSVEAQSQFFENNLEELLLKNSKENCKSLVQIIIQELKIFRKSNQFDDDICLIGIEI